MAPLFISTYLNKVDPKGRVSVPAPFRMALGMQAALGIIVYPSFKYKALEGCSHEWLSNIQSRIGLLDDYSDERDALESLIGQSCLLTLDPEGRIVLPSKLLAMIGVTEQVALVGTGKSFQFWAPAELEAHEAAMRKLFVDRKMTLAATPRAESLPA